MQALSFQEARAFSTRKTPNLTVSRAPKRLSPKDPAGGAQGLRPEAQEGDTQIISIADEGE